MPEIFDSGIISIQITRWQLKSTQPHFLFQNRTAVAKNIHASTLFLIEKIRKYEDSSYTHSHRHILRCCIQ